jgi:glutamine synthetase
MPGQWQSFSVPASSVELGSLEHGVGLDGASIRGFQKIDGSQMWAIPEPASAFLDPFAEMPTLVLICNIRNPISGQPYTCDPRYVAQKAEAYLQTTQIGGTANFGLVLEHFVVDGARNDQSANNRDGDSVATNGTAGRRSSAGQGTEQRTEDAYFPVPPKEVVQDVRTQIVTTLDKLGIKVEVQGDEITTGGQVRIDMPFANLTRMADNVMIHKYVVENVGRRNGMAATFMPQQLLSDSGSGMRVHQSIWQGEQPLFAGDGYAGTSALMRHYIAGLVEHAPALLAICAPTAHSPPRLVPGLKAPVKLGHARRNSAVPRIPMYSPNPKAKRVEFYCPDASCNPYLAFAAMLMAGIDGFHNRLYNIDPEEPIDKFYDQRPLKRRG